MRTRRKRHRGEQKPLALIPTWGPGQGLEEMFPLESENRVDRVSLQGHLCPQDRGPGSGAWKGRRLGTLLSGTTPVYNSAQFRPGLTCFRCARHREAPSPGPWTPSSPDLQVCVSARPPGLRGASWTHSRDPRRGWSGDAPERVETVPGSPSGCQGSTQLPTALAGTPQAPWAQGPGDRQPV